MSVLSSRFQSVLIAVSAVSILFVSIYTIKGFVPALAWAVVLAIGFWPLHQKLQKTFKFGERMSALAITAVMALILILPLISLSYTAALDVGPLFQWVRDASQNGLAVPDWISQMPMGGPQITSWWNAHLSTADQMSQTFGSIKNNQPVAHGESVAIHAAHGVTEMAFSVLTLFFMLANGTRIVNQILNVSRDLFGSAGEAVLLQILQSVRGTIAGLVLVGIGEGVIIGIAYFLAGLPHSALLTILTAIAAMLPFCALIVVGVASLIALTHGAVGAIVLLVFALAVIFIADHFVRPKLIGEATHLPFLLVLFGILGGLETWGLIGLFIGPALMAASMMIWMRSSAEKES